MGLLIGSFLNVVIHRLPLMMQTGWDRDCRELLELPPEVVDTEKPFNLITPRSACPHCQTPIKAWQNVPVVSWVLLRGKCARCGHGISIQYPLVELLSGTLTLVAAWQLGVTATTLAVWMLGWILIAAAIIDLKTTLLPDILTQPLLWLGLLLALLGVGTSLSLKDAVIGAMAGYLVLWSVYWLFKLATGREGMGYGDFKLLAALGAWLGWQQLPLVLLLSAGVGAVIGIGMILFLKHDKRIPIPFGPYLASAGLLAYYLGTPIVNLYLGAYRF
ncbi:MAG TPA: A24 family peptidase [Halothiobacillus sp.]|nr:A24 family peptidase [Halothiobacillus sp.]